jgi:hypothetical protein
MRTVTPQDGNGLFTYEMKQLLLLSCSMEVWAMSQKQSVDREAEGTQVKQSLNADEACLNDYIVLGDAKELTKNGRASSTESNRGHS